MNLFLIINRNMEEKHKVLQFIGLSNSEYIQHLQNILTSGQVQKISFFVTFRTKNLRQKQKIQKSLSQNNDSNTNILKQKKTKNQILQKFRASLLLNQKLCDLKEQIGNLYQCGQYDRIVQILIPKQIVLRKQINQLIQESNVPKFQKIKKQYNSITFQIGNSFFRLKNFDKAIEYYQKFVQDQPIRQKAQRMNNLGTCYAAKKTYQLALKFYNQAVKSYNQCDEEDVSSLLNNIAMIYLKCQMFKSAQGFFNHSIQERKSKSPNNKLMLYNSYFNLGVCQKKMEKLEESLNNLFIALNYAYQGHGNKVDVLTEICKVYELQERWSQALTHYEKLSQEYENLGKSQGMIYERVSKIHEKIGNGLLAAKFAKEAYKLYNSVGDERKMSELLSELMKPVPTN